MEVNLHHSFLASFLRCTHNGLWVLIHAAVSWVMHNYLRPKNNFPSYTLKNVYQNASENNIMWITLSSS